MIILVAEDNTANRELLREALGARGHTVVETRSGSETLDSLRSFRPDLVLLDIQMPGLDGYEVIRHIRADQQLRTLKVVAVTAFAMRGEREKALAAGFDSYLSKPISLAQLYRVLKEVSGAA